MFKELTLHPHLQSALEKNELVEPTDVQQQAIPMVLAGKDLLVSAETGSGKTIAFALPTLQRLLDNPDSRSGTRALVLAPTRELARQISEQFLMLGSYTQFRFGLIIGGEGFQKQTALLRKNPEVIIATPGRILDHLNHGTPHFKDLEVLILDEADRMLDMGFADDVLKIAEHCNSERQTLLFSATLTHKGLHGISSKVLNEPQALELNNIHDQHANIEQQYLLADENQHKFQLVDWLLKNESFEKGLIFTNTIIEAQNLGDGLRRAEHRCGVLHGEMDQHQRNQVMKRFREGFVNILVATDVASRGLDVQGIDLVINFDMARNGKDYVHRIGRTGRAGQQGVAFSLINHQEWNLKAGIERFLRQSMNQLEIEGLAAKYQGPKKVKKSGKAAGAKKKKTKDPAAEKAKSRLRNKKNIGKRKKPSENTERAGNDQQASEQPKGNKAPGKWASLRKKTD